MELFLQGIIAGLGLAILVGPLLFALIQESIERGAVAGLMVALGIWMSDALFITAVYSGAGYLDQVQQWPWFRPSLAIGGSIILFFVGLGMIWKASPNMDLSAVSDAKEKMTYWSLWLKGFLINTINPFTVFFWIFITNAMVKEGASSAGLLSFFVGILGTIIFTDSLKVSLAEKIRNKLKPLHIYRMRIISGSVLILFGVSFLIRFFLLPG